MWHRPARPSVPEGLRIYAIADVHGCRTLLDRLLDAIDRDAAARRGATAVRIFLGDYIDRGPDSAAVIERLLEFCEQDPHAVFLRGNHEQTLLDFFCDPRCYRLWCRYGAESTLLSYGVAPPLFAEEEPYDDIRRAFGAALPPPHRAFLESTRSSHTVGDYLFVHAGIRPNVFLDEQCPKDMMWIREEFLSSDSQYEKIVVHGHSPVKAPQIRSNRIGIDAQAYKTGRLTALVLEGDSQRFLTT